MGVNPSVRAPRAPRSATFTSGTVVILTATPPVGKAFLGWTDACLAAGTNTTCSITMSANKTAKANFGK